jgi:hypothetical protein
MKVVISHHVDASEPDEQGFHDYHYEYDIYRFSFAERCYVVRSYCDQPGRADFLSCQEGSESRLVGPRDLADPLLAGAVDYLRAAGKTSFERLGTEGYVPLEAP